MLVSPTWLVEVMCSMPGMVENWLSSGVATVDAMTSGFAPGSAACTRMVGYSTSGRLLTGKEKELNRPKPAMAAISSVVVVGGVMRESVKRIFRRLGLHRRRARFASGRGA